MVSERVTPELGANGKNQRQPAASGETGLLDSPYRDEVLPNAMS